MPDLLKDKVVVITGAGRGVGQCIAEYCSQQGARVVVNDLARDEDGKPIAEAVAEGIRQNGGQAIASTANIAQRVEVEEMIQTTVDLWGRVDGLVNNAGILRDRIFHKMSEEEWDQSIAVNLKGCFNTARAVAPFMKEQGSGAMVHMTSTSGLIGNFGQSNYAAAKMGLVGLSKSIALDMQRFNVRSNCIAPFALTPMIMAGIPRDTEEGRERWKILEKMEPEKVAPLVCALIADGGAHINGQIFGARGNEVYFFSQPRPVRTAHIGDGEGINAEAIIDRVFPMFKDDLYPLHRSMDIFSWDPV
ncbi:SDR family NAD(P)-dependent oxidoreductase [Spongiibacter sp. KMU-166]|uniref:SDR family NAD(P)-dependent oxidoreductase n=1 Tax=Spongiibacter thalassae TaxID=2721624 RepID=A0ABX1GCS9_9GAMM|nr:SDR family NAD(P)-dependent oxidoreductase [Spongiibacter thalassae]NKI16074.1 SDR family NAD(P)-dependent oxidoreductase [Spongiibacter thalassae]